MPYEFYVQTMFARPISYAYICKAKIRDSV